MFYLCVFIWGKVGFDAGLFFLYLLGPVLSLIQNTSFESQKLLPLGRGVRGQPCGQAPHLVDQSLADCGPVPPPPEGDALRPCGG